MRSMVMRMNSCRLLKQLFHAVASAFNAFVIYTECATDVARTVDEFSPLLLRDNSCRLGEGVTC